MLYRFCTFTCHQRQLDANVNFQIYWKLTKIFWSNNISFKLLFLMLIVSVKKKKPTHSIIFFYCIFTYNTHFATKTNLTYHLLRKSLSYQPADEKFKFFSWEKGSKMGPYLEQREKNFDSWNRNITLGSLWQNFSPKRWSKPLGITMNNYTPYKVARNATPQSSDGWHTSHDCCQWDTACYKQWISHSTLGKRYYLCKIAQPPHILQQE